MKRKYLLLIIAIILLTPLILKTSFAMTDDTLKSNNYEIKNNTIYAIPTSFEYKVDELIYNVDYTKSIEAYNNTTKLNNNDNLGTGSIINNNNITYNVVVLGDINGDGKITLGDVSAVYNHYRNNRTLDGLKLEASKLTGKDKVSLGDVSKLYNFYKGNKPFTFYSDKDWINITNYVELASNYYENNKTSNKIGTNIIDELNIEDKNDNDQIIITKDGKIELAISKNNRCYRKSALSDDIELIENDLCNANVDSFVSNRGELHVSGTKLLDENNREIRLVGASGVDLSWGDNITTYESIHSLKNWGANLFRFFINADLNYMTSYVDDKEYNINGLKRVLDNVIANDMYIVISWSGVNENGMNYIEEAKDFFTTVASMYPNDPHIIYEIWNEPENNNTWSEIKQYSNELIPAIRNISSKSIILVPTTNFDSNPTNPVGDMLPYNNIMYTAHMYMNSFSKQRLNDIETALNNDVPIFISEWGTSQTFKGGESLVESSANAFVRFLNKHNLSHAMFAYCESKGESVERFCITRQGEWTEKLTKNTLKENGLYMRNVISNNFSSNINLMDEVSVKDSNNLSNSNDYRNDDYRNKIESIEFKDTLNIPSNVSVQWDLSFAKDNSVIGYLIPTENEMYKLVIAANGTINAPSESSYLFADMKNLKSIDFTNFKTSGVQSITAMFKGDANLEELDLSNFDTSNIIYMWTTFHGCKKLRSINFDGWNPKLSGMGVTFYGCESLEELDLSNFDVSKVTTFNSLFEGASSLKKINISTWNPTNVTKINSMFNWTKSLEYVDMSSFTISDSTDVTNALYNAKADAKIIVKDQSIIDKLQPTANNNLDFVISE